MFIIIVFLRERVEEILFIVEIKFKEVCDVYYLGLKFFLKNVVKCFLEYFWYGNV